MEVVDNGVMLAIPGAMEAGIGDILFWGALAFAPAIAGVVALPVNRWLIGRGRGHTAVHGTGIHGGPPVRPIGALTAPPSSSAQPCCWPRRWTGGDDSHEPAGSHAAAPAAGEPRSWRSGPARSTG